MQVTHTIQETNSELCFVAIDFEEHCYNFNVIGVALMFDINNDDTQCIRLTDGNDWKLIGGGILDQIKEEDLEGIMPSNYVLYGRLYYGYNKEPFEYSAKDSLLSLMQMLKLYTVNPYGEKPMKTNSYEYENGWNDFNEEPEQWQQAQSRTHANYAILVRPINK